MLRMGIVVVGWLMLLAGSVTAEHRGALAGRVVDGGGAPVSRTRVTATSEATGASRSAVTSADGRFTIPRLDPGSYRLTLDDDRYRSFAARYDVRLGETAIVTLTPALPSTSVNVDFRPYFQYVDRTSSAFRTWFDGRLIEALPLDGRRIVDLAALTPGLTTTATGLVTGGSLPTSTAFLLDGVAAFDPLFGTALLPVLPESVLEFSVFTPPLEARFGRSAGAQVSVVTRSGTNEWQGSAFAFRQQEAKRTQWGGMVGGPVRRDSTFVYADFGRTSSADAEGETGGFTQASGRLDQITGAGRLTGRYDSGRGGPLDRGVDRAGVTYVQQLSTSITNEARFGFSRLEFGDRWAGVLPEFDTLEAANVLTWSASPHLVTGGVEYFTFEPVAALGLTDEATLSAFVQDQWRASSRLSLTGGVRFDRRSRDGEPQDAEGSEDDSLLSPRAGFAWALGERHVVRGDYGRHLQEGGAALDAWSVGVQRQWGRSRTLEAGYLGTRVDDDWSGFGSDAHYHALRVQLQQRSETATSAHIGYTYSRWTVASAGLDRVRASLDSPHKVTAAFAWHLPFGDEGRWLTDGLLGTILGDLQVSGIAVTQSGRPRTNRNLPPGPPWRNVDFALIKAIRFGDPVLELRAEVFNVSNRTNPRPSVLGAGFEELFSDENRGRRFQFGGRWRF